MNNTHIPVGKAMNVGILRLDHPQSIGMIGLVPNHHIPVHKGAGVFSVGIRESKEEENASDEETLHPRTIQVPCTDEDTIPSWGRDIALHPPWCGANHLSVHPPWAR